MGNLLSVVVHAANLSDTKTGIKAVREAYKRYPGIKGFCADAGYRGTFVRQVEEEFGCKVDISEKIKPHQWEKLRWRWVVERTFAWINNSRRLSKDYEISITSAQTMCIISSIRFLLARF